MRYRSWSFLAVYSLLCISRMDASVQEGDLLADLELVYKIDQELKDRLPLFYNYFFTGGYYNMPSARMGPEGDAILGASVPTPYRVYGLTIQPFERLELSANYLVYKGFLEPGFGAEGFGDDAERMANLKVGIITPREDLPFFPLISFGAQDFIGTKRFNAQYIVATQSWLDANCELTLGWGHGRIRGFFGGGAWTPFRQKKTAFRNITLQVEYDANDYENNPGEHEKGRSVTSRLNAGISLLLADHWQMAISSIRGETIGGSLSFRYPLGVSSGFFPKMDDPALYHSPLNREPMGVLRSEREFAYQLAYALADQGLDLYSVYLSAVHGKKILWIQVVNNRYRSQTEVQDRVRHVLGALVPQDIEEVIVTEEATALLCQSYRYRVKDLYRYQQGKESSATIDTLSPIQEVITPPSEYEAVLLFRRTKPVWTFTVRPRFTSFFGNANGKFKYNLGVVASPEGYLFDEIYYKTQVGYSIFSNTTKMSGVDRQNPSHMFVVRSDSMKYYQTSSVHLEQAFLQRSWNLGRGCFYRLAGGYFELAYAGAATELLYYPAGSSWAFGVECATVWKRHYEGLGFFHKVAKFDGTKTQYFPFTGVQAFFDIYYQCKPLSIDFTIKAGRFLAKDLGARFEVGKTFLNGVRFALWYSLTNANEELNGHRYHDKGFSFLIPLDMCMKQSSRNYVGYAMAAWLRDQAASADTGKKLYSILAEERFSP
ncbi:MAG: YjbH domain-containing protein [Chlamydiae bacterium]|nr:YjbH domain-containing protein [Chlamydiota bacterium]